MKLTTVLKQLRKENGLTQKELAAILHVSNGTISNYESGVHSPNLDTVCTIADYYRVSVDYLLGRTESPYAERELIQCISGMYTVNDLLRLVHRLPEPSRKSFVAFLISLEHLLDTLMQQKRAVLNTGIGYDSYELCFFTIFIYNLESVWYGITFPVVFIFLCHRWGIKRRFHLFSICNK